MSPEPPCRPLRPSSYVLPSLVLLMAASGCAALIYEVVWYQLLQLAIGSTSVSLGILLATFMGGMGLGSIAVPRLVSPRRRPLRVFAALEAGIALCGVLILSGVPYLDRVYFAAAGRGLPGMLLRGLLAAICLLPPTILMGASLPVVSRCIGATRRGAFWWGLLYGSNTAGAVFGSLLAGFYLLRIHNVAVATYAAAGVNLAVALAACLLGARTAAQADPEPEAPAACKIPEHETAARWTVYLAAGVSGACALGAEAVWTRLVGMMLGLTVYAFSIILAVFLAGLAAGSAAGAALGRAVSPRVALGWSQLLAAAGVAWTAFMITASLPFWPIDPMLSESPWYTFQLDLARCLWAVLPPTLAWGASFPLALAAVRFPGGDPGRQVGSIYAANTFGSIVGALALSLVLTPALGTQHSQRVLLAMSAAAGMVVLAPYVRRWSARAAMLAAVALVVCGLAGAVRSVPPKLILHGRRMLIWPDPAEFLYTAEGRNSSLVVARWADGALGIGVNGHVEATTEPHDMKLQRMVGHLPALLHPSPESVLGIGFGAGVSAGAFTTHPSVRRITICEIEPLIPPASARFFGEHNHQVFHDPRTRIVYDDARHYVLTTRETFDIIASDPLDVFAKGTAALYTREYFEAVKRRLKPGGVFTLYVPLYESDLRTVQSEFATFFEAFPHGSVWANTVDGQGYDLVLMGQVGPLRIDLDEIDRRWKRPDYASVVRSLGEAGVTSPFELLATYAGRGPDFAAWVKEAQINSDRDLRLQYLAGWGMDSRMQDQLYREIMRQRRQPEGVFVGSADRVERLFQALAWPPAG